MSKQCQQGRPLPLVVVYRGRGVFRHFYDGGVSHVQAPLSLLESWMMDNPDVEVIEG